MRRPTLTLQGGGGTRKPGPTRHKTQDKKQPAFVFYGRLLKREGAFGGGRRDRRRPFVKRSLPLVNKSNQFVSSHGVR